MAVDVSSVREWLIDGGRSSPVPGDMVDSLCRQLIACGIPLFRVAFYIRTLHPDIFGRNFIWRPDEPIKIGTADHSIIETPQFLASPISVVAREGREIRARVGDPESERWPIVEDLRAEGVTDYIALPIRYIDGSAHTTSWTTKQAGGFTDEQVDALRSIIAPLSRLIEVMGLRRVATTLLDTYVGNRAGEKILAGQIRRGHTENMNAAIWLSDLRSFTALSDRLPPETVVDILNTYFDCQVAAIKAHGGEVLKYMGDGLLAVFPIDEYVGDSDEVCAHALEAARKTRAAVDAMQYSIGDTIERFRFGVALHVGPILYGNIGGGSRLDFTCIGPAVNLAARLEKLTGRLRRTIVASEGFAGICSGDWCDLGEFPIAGFSRAQRVYGLHDEQAQAAA
ncbi:MAG: adenylate/guanylate cyclase domain-containing protein [Bradyrhizobium sp.]